MRIFAFLLIVLAAGTSCDDKKAKTAPAPVPSPAQAKPPVAAEDVPAGAGAQVEKMFVQLEHEKTHRPPVTPTVETVLGALEAAGVKLDEKKQVLGLTVGARFCMRAGNNTNGLNVIVCEYESPAAAKAGIERVTTTFAQVAPTSTFATKGSTTVQVMDRPNQPLTDVRRTIDAALATL